MKYGKVLLIFGTIVGGMFLELFLKLVSYTWLPRKLGRYDLWSSFEFSPLQAVNSMK